MKINILTIFPEMFRPLKESMLGRAEENGIIEFNIVDVREFSLDKHRKTDDYPFGGGQGMVFMPQPAFDALKSVGADHTRNIYMSPRGRVLDMDLALELADYLQGNKLDLCKTTESGTDVEKPDACSTDVEKPDACPDGREYDAGLTVFCGHYEGIDQRIIDAWNMEEVSIGDYILTGGELAAMVLIDVVARLIPGVLGEENSAIDESIYSGLLEFPQFTKPRSFIYEDAKLNVPEALLSGNHKEIGLWRFRESIRLTKRVRPDILKSFLKTHRSLDKEELHVLMSELNKREFEMLKRHLSEKERKSFEKILEKQRKNGK